jgi:hypothetical protein
MTEWWQPQPTSLLVAVHPHSIVDPPAASRLVELLADPAALAGEMEADTAAMMRPRVSNFTSFRAAAINSGKVPGGPAIPASWNYVSFQYMEARPPSRNGSP